MSQDLLAIWLHLPSSCLSWSLVLVSRNLGWFSNAPWLFSRMPNLQLHCLQADRKLSRTHRAFFCSSLQMAADNFKRRGMIDWNMMLCTKAQEVQISWSSSMQAEMHRLMLVPGHRWRFEKVTAVDCGAICNLLSTLIYVGEYILLCIWPSNFALNANVYLTAEFVEPFSGPDLLFVDAFNQAADCASGPIWAEKRIMCGLNQVYTVFM